MEDMSPTALYGAIAFAIVVAIHLGVGLAFVIRNLFRRK